MHYNSLKIHHTGLYNKWKNTLTRIFSLSFVSLRFKMHYKYFEIHYKGLYNK